MPTLLITRPEPDASICATQLRALDLDSIVQPLMRRVALEAALPEPGAFAAMALTSANALRALRDRGEIHRWRQVPVFCVGEATAAEADIAGFTTITSAGGRLADLVETLVHHGVGGPVFYPCGLHLSGDLARSVGEHGVSVTTLPVYDMVAVDAVPEAVVEGIEAGLINGVLLYSRRTAQIFVDRLGARLSRQSHLKLAMLCLSEKVAEPLLEHHFARIALADRPDDDAMMALALAFARDHNAP